MLPRVEPSSDVQTSGNLMIALHWNSPSLHKLLRKDELSFRCLFIFSNGQERLIDILVSIQYSCPLLHPVRKLTMEHRTAQIKFNSCIVIIDLQFDITLVWSVVLVQLARLVSKVYKIAVQRYKIDSYTPQTKDFVQNNNIQLVMTSWYSTVTIHFHSQGSKLQKRGIIYFTRLSHNAKQVADHLAATFCFLCTERWTRCIDISLYPGTGFCH